jgi:hypothetical protein
MDDLLNVLNPPLVVTPCPSARNRLVLSQLAQSAAQCPALVGVAASAVFPADIDGA